MNWEEFRRPDGSIDLVAAFATRFIGAGQQRFDRGAGYLRLLESLQPINSRQAAAVAVATALSLA